MSLSDRPRPRMVLVESPLSQHLFAFVWLPRDDVSTGRRVAIEEMLVRAANAHLLSWSMAMEESGVALIRYALDLRHEGSVPNSAQLKDRKSTRLNSSH